MNWLSLRKNRSKLETSGELLIILEESIEEHSSTLPGHWSGGCSYVNRGSLVIYLVFKKKKKKRDLTI